MAGLVARFDVTVDDGYLTDVESVARALRASGMEVERVLGTIGVITGRAPADARPVLLAVEGVSSVDEQVHVRLAPPDSPVQ